MKLELRYPATVANAREHAALAVEIARREHDGELDYSPASLEDVDAMIERLREEGATAEEAAEALFVFGCYLGEVLLRALAGQWVETSRSPLAEVSPWPMVVVLPDGSGWDAIGKAYRRLEVGDSEYLPGFLEQAARHLGSERGQ